MEMASAGIRTLDGKDDMIKGYHLPKTSLKPSPIVHSIPKSKNHFGFMAIT